MKFTAFDISSSGNGYLVRVVNKTLDLATLKIDGTELKLIPNETLGATAQTIEQIASVYPLIAIPVKTQLSEVTTATAQDLARWGVVRNPGRTYEGSAGIGAGVGGLVAAKVLEGKSESKALEVTGALAAAAAGASIGANASGFAYDGALAKKPAFMGNSYTFVPNVFGDLVVILAPMHKKGLAKFSESNANARAMAKGIDFLKTSPSGVTISFYVYSADEADLAINIKTPNKPEIVDPSAKIVPMDLYINLSSKADVKSTITKKDVLGEKVLATAQSSRALLSGKFTKVWMSLTKNTVVLGIGDPGKNAIMVANDDFSSISEIGFVTDDQTMLITAFSVAKSIEMSFGGLPYFSQKESQEQGQVKSVIDLREKGLGAFEIKGLSSGSILLQGEKQSIELSLSNKNNLFKVTVNKKLSARANEQSENISFTLPFGAQNFLLNIFQGELTIGASGSEKDSVYEFVGSFKDPCLEDVDKIDLSRYSSKTIDIDNYGKWVCLPSQELSLLTSKAGLAIVKSFQYQIFQQDQVVSILDVDSGKSFVVEKCPQQGAIYPFELIVEADGSPSISLYNSAINPIKYALGVGGAALRTGEVYMQLRSAKITADKISDVRADLAITGSAIGMLLGGAALGSAAAALEAINKEGFRNVKESFVYSEKFKDKAFESKISKDISQEKQTASTLIEKLSFIQYKKTDDLEYACNLITQILSSVTSEQLTKSGSFIGQALVAAVEKMVTYACKGLLKATKSIVNGKVTFGPANHDVLIDMVIDSIAKILNHKLLFNFDNPRDFSFAKNIFQQLCKAWEFKFIKFAFNNTNLSQSENIISFQSGSLVDKKITIEEQETSIMSRSAQLESEKEPELFISDSQNSFCSTGLKFSAMKEFSKKVVSSGQIQDSWEVNAQEFVNEFKIEFDLIVNGKMEVQFYQSSLGQVFGPFKFGEPVTSVVIGNDGLEICLSSNGSPVSSDNDTSSKETNFDLRPSGAIAKRYCVSFKDGAVDLFVIVDGQSQKVLSAKDKYFKSDRMINVGLCVSGQAVLSKIKVTCDKIVNRELKDTFDKAIDGKVPVLVAGPDVEFYKRAKELFDGILALSTDDSSELTKFDSKADNQILSGQNVGLSVKGLSLGDTYGTLLDVASDFQWGGALQWTAKDAASYSRQMEEHQAAQDKEAVVRALGSKQNQLKASKQLPNQNLGLNEKEALTGAEQKLQAQVAQAIASEFADVKHIKSDLFGRMSKEDKKLVEDYQKKKERGQPMSREEEDAYHRAKSTSRWSLATMQDVRDNRGDVVKDENGQAKQKKNNVFGAAFEDGNSSAGGSKNLFTREIAKMAGEVGSIAKTKEKLKQAGQEAAMLTEKDGGSEKDKADGKVEKDKAVKGAKDNAKIDFSDKFSIGVTAVQGVLSAGQNQDDEIKKKDSQELKANMRDLSQAASLDD